MKIKFIVGILIIGAFLAFAPVSSAEAYSMTPVSGHRFATNVPGIPEQSLEALDYAHKAGVKAVEADVRFTADNKLVLLHDQTLDRTTNCTGFVEDITYSQLRGCANANIVPTLSSALVKTKAYGMYFNIEVKPIAYHPITAEQIDLLVRRIAYYGMTSRVVISSTSPEYLNKIKDHPKCGNMRFSLISLGPRVHSKIVASIGSVYMPKHATLTPEIVNAYQERGVQVWAWPGRTEEDFAKMKSLGVDVIVADNPQAAVSYLRSTA